MVPGEFRHVPTAIKKGTANDKVAKGLEATDRQLAAGFWPTALTTADSRGVRLL
jgi:hypothetical protein